MAFEQRYQPGQIPQFGSFGPPNMSLQIQSAVSRLADPFIARLRELEVANDANALKKDLGGLFKNQPAEATAAPGAAAAPPAAPTGDIHAPLAAANPEVRNTFLKTVEAGGLKNPYGLAAVAATGEAETSWSPGRVNTAWNDLGKPSGGTLSWRAERLKAMRDFTKGAEDPVAAQAQFFLNENPALIARLNEAKSPEEANTLMANAWRYKGFNQPGTGEFARRENLTRKYVAQLGTAAPPPAAAPTAAFAPSVAPAPTPSAQAAVGPPASPIGPLPRREASQLSPQFNEAVRTQNPFAVASLDPSIGIGQRQAAPEVAPRPVRTQSLGPDGQPLPPQQQPAPALPTGPQPNEQPTPPPIPAVPPVEPPPPIQPVVPPGYSPETLRGASIAPPDTATRPPPPPAPQVALPTPAAPPAPRVAPAVTQPPPPVQVAAGGPSQQAPQGQRYVAPVDPVAERFWLTQLKHAKTREEVTAIGQKLMELRQGQKPSVHITPQGLVEYDPNTRQARSLTQSPDRAPKTAKGPDGRDYAWNEARGGYVDPVGPPGGKTPLFSGNSVEGQALNHLVERGILSPDQAAEVGAGKSITNPADGSQYYFRPQDLVGGGSGLVRRDRDGAVTPVPAPGAAAPAPAAQAPAAPASEGAPNRGVQLTPPKPEKPENLTAETASRVALGNTFLKNVPEIRKKIQEGALDTPLSRIQLRGGYGDPGTIKRQIASGKDALLRGLTGAGMGVQEAAEYVERYEPSWRDDKRNLLEKIDGLELELKAVREGVLAGRKITDPALTGKGGGSSGKGFTTPGGTRFEEVR